MAIVIVISIITIIGWERLIPSHSSAWFCFELVKFELTVYFKHEMIDIWQTVPKKWVRIKGDFELTIFELTGSDLYLDESN